MIRLHILPLLLLSACSPDPADFDLTPAWATGTRSDLVIDWHGGPLCFLAVRRWFLAWEANHHWVLAGEGDVDAPDFRREVQDTIEGPVTYGVVPEGATELVAAAPLVEDALFLIDRSDCWWEGNTRTIHTSTTAYRFDGEGEVVQADVPWASAE